MKFLIAIKDKENESRNVLEIGCKIAAGFSADLTICYVGKKSKALIEGDVNLARQSMAEWNIYHPGLDVLTWAFNILKGKGFAGGMKRHNFKGLEASHGVKRAHRRPGSINGHATNLGTGPKPKKGKRMPGHMGNRQITCRSMPVIQIDSDSGRLRRPLLRQTSHAHFSHAELS